MNNRLENFNINLSLPVEECIIYGTSYTIMPRTYSLTIIMLKVGESISINVSIEKSKVILSVLVFPSSSPKSFMWHVIKTFIGIVLPYSTTNSQRWMKTR